LLSLIFNGLLLLLFLFVFVGTYALISNNFLFLLLLLLPFFDFQLLLPSGTGHVLFHLVFDGGHFLAEGAFFVLAPFAHLQKLVLGLFEWLFANFWQVVF
jgi:hypothetical protein